ncbi:intercellular adhesion molecule 4 [Neophocaena asiaeorientalis asiaeorientalis]|uniref:Intercellular adhesion molecule 4 n=1 Tax=Neophocaena asiaeorientalis asiaeorientalis TaxID=1706337 RepID=A0A341BHD9_NEOAA|nr:intercellular adhesion molecule 4 [Neophocaena asiaeorientalis asiaeorientalis]
MGSLLLLLLLLLLSPSYPRGGSAWRRRSARTQGPGGPSRAPPETSAPFWVRISPEFKAVPPGGSVWLNCSSSCPLPEGSSLRTELRRGDTLSGHGWVSYQLLDVRAWSSDVHCFVTCAGETRGATARITAYKQPRSVILEPPVLMGSEYTLRCHVTHVFPVGFLVVILRRGGRVIYSESLERFTGRDLANVTLTYALRARPSDFGQPVTCYARLDLDGLVVLSSSAPMTLPVLAWSPASKALASTSIAALVGILLVVGALCLRKYLSMKSQA